VSATNPQVTITGNGKTDPFDLRVAATDACFTLEGGTGGTVTPQYANKEGTTKVDGDYTADSTPIAVSANAGPFQIPFGAAKFVRFVGNGVTGTVTVRWGQVKDWSGNRADIGIEAPPTSQVTA